MTTSDYMNAILGPLLRQYWWLILLIIAASILKLFVPVIKGRIGEGLVNLAAKLRLDPKVYNLIKDVTIPSKNGTTQIDHIIVSVFGLFVIETKNYKGWIYGSTKQKQWTQNIYGKKHRFQNPLHQNYAHTTALSDLLGISKDRIHGVVCFMGDAEFKTEIPEGVFIQGRYVDHIKSFKTPVFSADEVSSITQRIESGRFERGIKTNWQHVQQFRRKHAEDREIPSPGAGENPPSKMVQETARSSNTPHPKHPKSCPKCGEEMVLRTARRGANAGNQFWGCSAFPKCRTTRPLNLLV